MHDCTITVAIEVLLSKRQLENKDEGENEEDENVGGEMLPKKLMKKLSKTLAASCLLFMSFSSSSHTFDNYSCVVPRRRPTVELLRSEGGRAAPWIE